MWSSARTRYEDPQRGPPSPAKESSVFSLHRVPVEPAFWPWAAPRPAEGQCGWTASPILPLCLQTQGGLKDEVHQLEATIAILKQKLAQTQ